MKKSNVGLWYLPLCFFIFLAIFIFIKFVFIFFFNAAFQPTFMFDLTPYYLLAGVNNLHLIFLSLIVVGIDAYLHFKISKKNLIFSFIPTSVILASLGFKIATQEIEISYFLHYLLFGVLLIVLLVDHRHVLIFPETVKSPENKVFVEKKSSIEKIESSIKDKTSYEKVIVSEKPIGYASIDELLTLHKETLYDLRSVIKDDLRRSKDLLEELKHKTSKIDILEEEIRNMKYNSNHYEKNFNCPYKSFFYKKEDDEIYNDLDNLKFDFKNKKRMQEDDINIDNMINCAAIIKRGILKKVNHSFEQFLGFDKEILLEKTLVNFFAPESLYNIEEYYLKKLKGIKENSYKAVLLKNNCDKVKVEIIMKPIKFRGEIADLIIIKELKEFDL